MSRGMQTSKTLVNVRQAGYGNKSEEEAKKKGGKEIRRTCDLMGVTATPSQCMMREKGETRTWGSTAESDGMMQRASEQVPLLTVKTPHIRRGAG